MILSRAMLAMTLLVVACGGETLDVGREATGGTGGASGDPSFDGGAPEGPTNSTVIVSEERGIRDIALNESHLYWIEIGNGGSRLERCLPDDCKNTIETLRRSVTDFSFFGGDLYMMELGGSASQSSTLLSCPASDCTAPKKIATLARPSSSFVVDDSGIYWANRLDTAIYACPLAGCDEPERTVAGGFSTYGRIVSDEERLYYFVPTASRSEYNLESVFKDGTTPPLVIAGGIKNPTPLRIRDGFVYWGSSLPLGYVARCPVSGCTNGQPEILAKNQRYPLSVELEGDSLFWLNENAGTLAGSTTPATLQRCTIATCANDVAVIDRAMGPASWLNFGTTTSSQLLVANADAVFYVGDQMGRDLDGGVPGYLDFAIRRLPRSR